MNPIASFSGLATGMDTASLVKQLVQLERRPIRMLQRKQGNLNSMSGRLSTIKAQLGTMQDAAQALDGRDEVLVSTATSTDEVAVAVTTTGAASLGTYAVDVTSLATAERTYTDGVAAKDQTGLFGTGTLSITVGAGAAVDITVSAADTLETLVSRINASSAEVTAGILFDGTNYRMQVSGNDTGLANAITFGEAGTTLGLSNPANEKQAAADAVFTVDGFAMTRGSNLVADAIPGVSLELKAATTTPATVTIQRDAVALEAKLQTFVDGYNAVIKSINAEFAFSGKARLGDSLSGDSTLRGLQTRIRGTFGAQITGLTAPYDHMASIGVTVSQDGTASIDSAKLAAALADDPEAVSDLLQNDPATGISGIMANFDTLVDEFNQSGTGLLALKIDALGDQVDGIYDQIGQMELRIDSFEQRLRARFTAMEQMVSMLQGQSQQMLALMGQLR